MSEKYYIDSCIWVDYFENRSDKFRPLGEWALGIIKKIIKENGLFIFSDHLIDELETKYTSEKLNKFLEIIPEKLIIRINTNERQAKEAFKIKNKLKIPFGDVLHAILARDNNAILVTRDKHFYEIEKQVTIRKPEELI
ncbi:MAG: PIN domain-containing protein [Candidatus Woesearchaeota archaeon]